MSEPASGCVDDRFLQGGGEMGERMRRMDWAQTPLGPVEKWPQSLKTAVRIMLTSRQPMFVWWGRDLINLYNDAYRAIVGGKHPAALGQPASTIWREIWEEIGPRTTSVMLANEGTYDESLLLIMERHGYPEETYYTFSYSPVPDDDGSTGGIICANTEDTRRIVGERQLALLRELAANTADARTFDAACSASARCLASNPRDLPFAMIYLLDPDKRRVRLAATCGIERGHPAAPESIDLDAERSPWPFAEVLRSHEARLVDDLERSFADLPTGAWPRAPHRAVAAFISPSGQTGRAGILVAGLNPFRLFDDGYRGFVDLVSAQIAASIGNAHAYEEEKRRAESLAELDRAKTAFFSNVSHEFRTPLTLLLGPIEALLGETAGMPAGSRDKLALAHRNGLRLLKLVNTLLDFSRIEAGRVDMVFDPTDLAAYTAELASGFRSGIEGAGMSLTIDCPPLPEPVYVDRQMWEKVVLNLLSNAFKHTFEGGIRLILRAVGGSAELEVSDSGTGIPVEALPRLFERFYRVHGARARTHEGSGIGLALVKELVSLHGGRIEVTSTLGSGTAFTVSLPLGRAHLPPDRVGGERTLASTAIGAAAFAEEALRWTPDGAATDLSDSGTEPNGRIVLADDNADMRAYVSSLLAPHYRVEAVADGAAAMAAIRREPPDLVLTDVMMPGVDGFGLLAALREDTTTRGVPVIMISARAGEESRVEGLDAGADDYLIKPFSARELLARVGAHLNMSRFRADVVRRERALRAEAEGLEHRYRELLHALPVAVFACDAEGRLTMFNDSALSLWGRKPEDEVDVWCGALGLSEPDGAPIPPDRSPAARAVREGRPRRDEVVLARPDGSRRHVLAYPQPIRNASGAVAGAINVLVDITERREAENALRDADLRKDEFIATLAHELRNPLAPISYGLHVMGLPHAGAESIEHVRGMMERQVRQMVRLIDDLLDVSRISRGKIALHVERVDLAAVVMSAVETSRPLIQGSGHELTLSMPPDPIFVDADVTRLAQAVANLLNNAAKYTPRGGHIRLTVEAQEGSGAAVSVTDDGIGIPPAMLGRVFDMFTQVDRSLEKTQGGLGMGLTIVKRLVEMHGGHVEARSDGLGKGSEFVIRLRSLPASRRGQNGDGGEAPADATDRRRILIVDDNRDSALALSMMLDIMGHETRTAHDGLEALATADDFRPRLILLDIGMPKLNGYEACRRLRAQPWASSAVIVALTGWGQEEDRKRSREAGFDHHLVKPVDPVALRALVASLR